MQQTNTFSADKLFGFVNKHRAELRSMPLSQELYKILLIKSEFTPKTIFEVIKQLLYAEKNATLKQKFLFKNIDNELNIPYLKAKELDKDGKLTEESFIQLFAPATKSKIKPPEDKPMQRPNKI